MLVNFVEKVGGPDRLVCEAELLFDDDGGPLAGMKLVGFTLWSNPDGEVFVTFPSRAFGGGQERRFFDYVRSADGLPANGRRLKAWLLEEYRSSRRAA